MPRLPNFLIHLSGFLRPERLRPDIRVPNIAHVDFVNLRRTGFNAVVIDKDNCITLPEHDEVYQPLSTSWTDLLASFPPGRVLVVSNSAGTPKDPSSIAAENVSLNLRAPVLVRKTPKPGCAQEIIAYFNGRLGTPSTLRGQLHKRVEAMKKIEREDEKILLKRWMDEAERSPIGHTLDGKYDRVTRGSVLQDKMVKEEVEVERVSEHSTGIAQDGEELRILVVGDRLFTDTLLADRLARLLNSKGKHPIPNVLSIHTTALPQPNDVPLLRWIERKVTGDRLKTGSEEWKQYVRNPYTAFNVPPLSAVEAEPKPTWKDKWADLKGDVDESRLRLDPRTWTLFDLVVGVGRGVDRISRATWHGVKIGSRWIVGKSSALFQTIRPDTSTSSTGSTAVAPSILEGRRIG